jgi:hypothetical protein
VGKTLTQAGGAVAARTTANAALHTLLQPHTPLACLYDPINYSGSKPANPLSPHTPTFLSLLLSLLSLLSGLSFFSFFSLLGSFSWGVYIHTQARKQQQQQHKYIQVHSSSSSSSTSRQVLSGRTTSLAGRGPVTAVFACAVLLADAYVTQALHNPHAYSKP